MRLTTMMSVALLGLSTAALAQVASTPAEQKPEGNVGGDDVAVMNNTATSSVNNATSANATAKATVLTPQTGDPTAPSSKPRKP